MNLPDKIWLTRKDVVSSDAGITLDDFKKAVGAGALPRKVFPGCRYGKYRRSEVIRVFGLEG